MVKKDNACRPMGIALLLGGLIISLGCQAEPSSTPSAGPQPTTQMQAQKATAGVGKRGQSLQDDQGVAKIVSGPASALLKVEQKVVLDIQIPQALQLFKASNGRFPKSHDEFMSQIVQANRLQLPELPDGMVYRFNSEKGELWVYPEAEAP